jgi:iron(III) transport system ATP-binding protein
MHLLQLLEVTKRFAADQPPAVNALTLQVNQGEILTLLGPSGCGKTTALRLVAGFEVPDSGSVVIRGELMAGPSRWSPPEARGVGIVFQDYALFPHLTVADNVGFGLRDLGRSARRTRVAQILELVGLEAFADRYPHELSGGQQQRVAVARALAPAPAVILLDEPFSNLDADLRAQMRGEIEKILRNTRTTAIFVTHDQEEAFTLADRVGVLNQGRLEQLDTPYEIYHNPSTRFVAEFVGAADFLPGLATADGIVTELGVFPNTDGRKIGERMEVMIRPDDTTFVLAADGDATIVGRSFRGPENLYSVRLPSGHLVHSSQPSSAFFATGARVRVEAHVIHVVTFPVGAHARRS